ncbi:hypothetical protein ACQJBY_050353 [Aegilops geniculata]
MPMESIKETVTTSDVSKMAVASDAALGSTPWHHVKEMLAGGIAGVTAKTAVAPLDRVKLLRQVGGGAAPAGTNAFRTLLEISRREGPRGLYRGNGTNALRVFPSKAIHFMAYEQYRSWLLGAVPSLGGGPVVDLLAGSAAGGTSLIATYPLDLARTRLACRATDAGVFGVLRSAYAEGGVRGLYRGACPSLARVLPTAGLRFYVYESLKRRLPEDYEGRVDAKVVCGMAAGLVANTATYPLSVVRRQMQLGGTGTGTAVTGALQGVRAIARAQGARQLYAGLGLTFLKAAPSAAIGLVSYEEMKALLNLPANHH